MDLRRRDDENEEQYLWRLGQAKDVGIIDLSWDEIAHICNREFRDSEDEYWGSSAYRKPYQQAKRFFESNAFGNFDQADYQKSITEAMHELKKQKQQLSDERTALNKRLREDARLEEDLRILKGVIQKNGRTVFEPVKAVAKDGDNDLLIVLSDIHLGLDIANAFGEYNSDIAQERLQNYLQKIVDVQRKNKSKNAYLVILGDIISGEIHFTIQLENRENVTEQVQKSAEMLSAFTYELSKHFENVYVNGVAGNHSRTSYKDEVVRGNRLDNLIPWYMKAKLEHIQNVFFVDDKNIDATIGDMEIRGKHYWLLHGDFDSFDKKGVSNLVMMIGYKPEAILYGHLHKCSYDEVSGVKLIRGGSLCGCGDDYTVKKRLYGCPTQMVCVITDYGVESCYPMRVD